MAISFPRELPQVPIKSSRFGLNVNQAAFEAGLSRKVTVQSHAGGLTDRWEGVYTTAELTKDQMAELSAWVTSMRGREGKFFAYDPDRAQPRGVATPANSTPQVNGASQIGRVIVTDGWQASTTGLLQPGDYFQIGSGYHMVLDRVDSDALGNAIINFEPVLRTSPADNAPIVFTEPRLTARLATLIEGWETGARKTGTLSFSWEEVI